MSGIEETPDVGWGQLSKPGPVGIRTFFSYLFGGADSIRALAASPGIVRIGLVLVLSAGLAREYDGEYLLREPWHALIPLAASLTTATILFHILYLIARNSDASPSYGRLFLSFLGLYWFTAPLAWFYAIPYERFLTATESVITNLLTLAAVAAWRVCLMMRVARILLGLRPVAAIAAVLVFADIVFLVSLVIVPLPVISIMGGIRLSDEAELVAGVSFLAGYLSIFGLPFLLIALGFAAKYHRRRGDCIPPLHVSTSPPTRHLRRLTVGAIAAGLLLLPIGQPEQGRRYDAEHLLGRGAIDEALSMMEENGESAFPPHWDPPPRLDYGKTDPDPLPILERVIERHSPEWIRSTYIEKWIRMMEKTQDGRYELTDSGLVYRATHDELQRASVNLRVACRLPELEQIFNNARYPLDKELGKLPEDSPDAIAYRRLRDALAERLGEDENVRQLRRGMQ